MRAIDTNIIVRFLTGDHPEQAQKARAILGREDLFIGTTVLLETEWVLRSGYGYAPAALSEAFRALAGLPSVKLEDPARVAHALDAMERGMDFADALHLAAADACESFITFDRQLAKTARAIGEMTVESP